MKQCKAAIWLSDRPCRCDKPAAGEGSLCLMHKRIEAEGDVVKLFEDIKAEENSMKVLAEVVETVEVLDAIENVNNKINEENAMNSINFSFPGQVSRFAHVAVVSSPAIDRDTEQKESMAEEKARLKKEAAAEKKAAAKREKEARKAAAEALKTAKTVEVVEKTEEIAPAPVVDTAPTLTFPGQNGRFAHVENHAATMTTPAAANNSVGDVRDVKLFKSENAWTLAMYASGTMTDEEVTKALYDHMYSTRKEEYGAGKSDEEYGKWVRGRVNQRTSWAKREVGVNYKQATGTGKAAASSKAPSGTGGSTSVTSGVTEATAKIVANLAGSPEEVGVDKALYKVIHSVLAAINYVPAQ